MKHSINITIKLFICYILTLVFIIFGWSTGGTHLLMNQVMKNDAEKIYDNLKMISDNYITGTYGKSLSNDHLNKHISMISEYLNVRILVIKSDGLIIYDTEGNNSVYLFDYSYDIIEQTIVNDIVLDGFINKPFTSVSYPITDNTLIKGYLLAVIYNDDIYTRADAINIAFWPYVLTTAIITTLIFISLYFLICVPLKKTIKAAREYSNHNYDYTYKILHNDEFRELQNVLTIMASDLNNLEEYQKTFISNISHDFRSPLTSIRGYTEAMIDETIPPELHGKYLGIIQFETERLTKLTGNLLTLGNMDNRNKLDISEFDINSVIKQISITFEGACKNKNKQIKLIFDEPSTIVSADISKIQQVLYNLIDNAIKFCHSDSTIQISTTLKGDKVFVSVKDNGIGIPKEALGKIWERFYKTDLSRGKDKKGTGLGLSIVKEIINAHGENINVTSTVDVGTEFTFTLPRA